MMMTDNSPVDPCLPCRLQAQTLGFTIRCMEEGIVLNGRYRLVERVGSGGMATVYKAEDKALGRNVAIKILHESLTSDLEFLNRFQSEAHAAANLTHPNIVTVHDIGQDGRRFYIVMEYVSGKTLKEIVRHYNEQGRLMPIKRAIDLAIQICNGIGYAHRANLIHCDVKPQNVIVTADDRVKVADFGIARAWTEEQKIDRQMEVWGTPQYLAPEQAAGEAATPSTDVYAIGIVLYEMMAGRTPFQQDTPTEVALKHLTEQPPPVSQFNPAVPHQLEQILNKVLSKEPAGRYRTAGQLGRILSTYRERSSQQTGPLPAARPDSPGTPVSEQKTQIFQRRPGRPPEPTPATVPMRARKPKRPAKSASDTIYVPVRKETPETDWLAISLGIIALLALLGLMPLWYFVYRAWAG
jgi:serine/threonine protein kinase